MTKPRMSIPNHKDDKVTFVTWTQMGLQRGEILETYGLTTLASFQITSESELTKLDQIGTGLVGSIKRYLHTQDRRFRGENEPFRARTIAVYGSILEVPTVMAAKIFSKFPNNLPRLGFHTLGDIAKLPPDQFAYNLRRYMKEEYADQEQDWGWKKNFGTITCADLTERFLRWLADQGVWR